MEDAQAAEEQTAMVRQLIQRLRLCLHPDKNTVHPRAAEAFAKL